METNASDKQACEASLRDAVGQHLHLTDWHGTLHFFLYFFLLFVYTYYVTYVIFGGVFMSSLTVGQKLWFKNRYTGDIEVVSVSLVCSDFFYVQYQNRRCKVSLDQLGKKIFTYSSKPPSPVVSSSAKQPIVIDVTIPDGATCADCVLRNGRSCPNIGSPCSKFHGVYVPEPQTPIGSQRSCNQCKHRVNSTCPQIKDIPCDDWSPFQSVPKDEAESSPQYGSCLSGVENKTRYDRHKVRIEKE